ncbi:hypothetical protein D9M73_182950 [compost metagenome]
MFCPVITNSGFSSGYGSTGWLPVPLKSMWGGAPSHLPLNAGMLPSALPAFSAPRHVKSLPSRGMSSGAASTVPMAQHPNNNINGQPGD